MITILLSLQNTTYFCFWFIYPQDSKFGLNCWIWVIHLNISFLLSQFHCLFQIFIQKKKRLRKKDISDNNLIIIINIFDLLYFFFYFFCFIYFQDTKFGLNCWIWVIHLNISFLLSQSNWLFQIFIQKKKD